MTKKLYIIDGNAYVHRAFHALPLLTNSSGQVINAVYGFTRTLLKIVKRDQPDYLAVCFDSAGPTFRHKEFEQYKATRKIAPYELKAQIPMVQEIVAAFNIPVFSMTGYEADDLIATLVRRLEDQDVEVIIVSGDKDVLQLVAAKVKVLSEPKEILFDVKGVKEKYGFLPEHIRDYLGLCGDTSDNVPGVKGIGEKTATMLVTQYGSIEDIYSQLENIPPKIKNKLADAREQALLSKRLVTLEHNAPITVLLPELKSVPIDREKALSLFNKYEFKTLISELIEFRADENAQYRTMCTLESITGLVQKIKEKREVSVDVETDNTDATKAALIGMSFCLREKEAYYIPLAHKCLGGPTLAKKQVLEKVREILEDETIQKYGHNLKYDLLVLRNEGIALQGISFDTMIASYLLNPSKFNHNLEDVSAEYLQVRLMPISDLIGKGGKQITIDHVPADRVAQYSGAQVDMVWRLKQLFAKELESKQLDKLFYDVEMPLLQILADMEYAGILVDLPYLEKLAKEFTHRIDQLEEEIFALAGEKFNINSPQQLSRILFQKLQLPVIEKTKTGASTNEAVLRQLQKLHDLPKKIIQYRELAKLKSTYIDPIPDMVAQKTGRLHTSFNQTVTATGRLSSSDPNMQNIPIRTEIGRMIRRSFIPAKGCLFISADYSQIDLRVLAHICGDENMRRAFAEGEDIHTHTAAEIFGVKPTEVDDEKRRVAKMVNFGLSYGMSPYGLSQSLNIDQSTAKEYIERYFTRYRGVKDYMEKIVEQARRDGFVTTLLNRRRYLPEIHSSDRNIRSFAERVAINMPIQGTAADIVKVAMIHIAGKISQEKLRTKMLLQVHDELIFETPEDEIARVQKIIVKEMEKALPLNVPIKVNVSIGKNWRDLE